MNLGNTIKQFRQERGLKQNEFAKSCSITPSYLSQIESNIKEPNISILKTIANELGLPLPVLFFLSIDKSDIDENKHAAFDTLMPSIKSLVSEFFNKNDD